MISAGVLKLIGDALVEYHGQHAHQSLLDPKRHILLLDRFAGKDALELKSARCRSVPYRVRNQKAACGKRSTTSRSARAGADLLSYQINEIDGANLVDGEEERLEEQRGLLQNAQAVMEGLEGAGQALNGEEDGETTGALEALSVALRLLDGIAQFHSDYAQLSEKLHTLYYDLEDGAMRCGTTATIFPTSRACSMKSKRGST
jgi:DNA repair protein RecN (Recombination protein N)